MGGVPLHPAVVHVPLGVAMVIPLLGLWALAGSWRDQGASRWGVIAFLQVLVVAFGFYAMSLGEKEEEHVEQVVPEHALEEHEEAGKRFVWAGVAALVFSVVTMSTRHRATRWIAVAAVAAAIVTAGLGVLTGKRGGELVYVHGAASAHVKAPPGTIPDADGTREPHDDD